MFNEKTHYFYGNFQDYYHADGAQCSTMFYPSRKPTGDCFFLGGMWQTFWTCPVEAQRSRVNGGVCWNLSISKIELLSILSKSPQSASKALIAVLADASVVVALSGSKLLATMVNQTRGALDTTESGVGWWNFLDFSGGQNCGFSKGLSFWDGMSMFYVKSI